MGIIPGVPMYTYISLNSSVNTSDVGAHYYWAIALSRGRSIVRSNAGWYCNVDIQ